MEVGCSGRTNKYQKLHNTGVCDYPYLPDASCHPASWVSSPRELYLRMNWSWR